MKKLIVAVLTVLAVVVLVSCSGEQGATGPAGATGDTGDTGTDFGEIPANATILVNENFDTYQASDVGNTPTGWTRAAIWGDSAVYHSVTDTPYVSYNKCFKIITNASNFDRYIIKSPFINSIPNTLTGKVYISFYAKKNEPNKRKGFVFYINQLEKCRIDFTETSAITFYTSKTSDTTFAGAYNVNEWFKVNIVINLATDTYSVYIRNNLVENIPCYNSYEQRNDTTPITSGQATYTTFFGILTNSNINYANDTTYLDNIVIYYLP